MFTAVGIKKKKGDFQWKQCAEGIWLRSAVLGHLNEQKEDLTERSVVRTKYFGSLLFVTIYIDKNVLR